MSGTSSKASAGVDSSSSPSSSLRLDVLVFLICYLTLIGAAIGLLALASAVIAIQMS